MESPAPPRPAAPFPVRGGRPTARRSAALCGFVVAAAGLVATLGATFAASPAAAQDHGAGPDPAEMEKKVLEIERLMKEAEKALARSSGTEDAATAAKRIDELVDENAQKQTGKTGQQLREEAKSGSAEAARALEKLTEEAKNQAQGAGAGIKKLLEESKSQASGASSGIDWILKQVRSGGGGGGGGGSSKDHAKGGGGTQPTSKKDGEKDPKDGEEEKDGKDPKKPDGGKDPKDPKEGKDGRDRSDKPPESQREKPRNPEFEQWYAQLPSQVRKAYETQDWDSIPPQFRTVLREWTKKMAEEMDQPSDARRPEAR